MVNNPLSAEHNDFALFDLPVEYELSQEQLHARYLALLNSCHPDRYTDQPIAIQQKAIGQAAKVNLAYKTLSDPLARAQYYLRLKGVKVQTDSAMDISPDFLMKQMQWRDDIAQAATQEALASLSEQNSKICHAYEMRFAACAKNGLSDHPAVLSIIQEWLFFKKLAQQIKEKAGVLS